ncbi:hypothetical protein HDV00_006712 [Rhizophlyctis rosea]|nr:hypothetical protein HDV00_006712 [Rhizophlyctis rosea]
MKQEQPPNSTVTIVLPPSDTLSFVIDLSALTSAASASELLASILASDSFPTTIALDPPVPFQFPICLLHLLHPAFEPQQSASASDCVDLLRNAAYLKMEDFITKCCKRHAPQHEELRTVASFNHTNIPFDLLAPVIHHIPQELDKLKLILHWSSGITIDVSPQVKTLLHHETLVPYHSLTAPTLLRFLATYPSTQHIIPASVIATVFTRDMMPRSDVKFSNKLRQSTLGELKKVYTLYDNQVYVLKVDAERELQRVCGGA